MKGRRIVFRDKGVVELEDFEITGPGEGEVLVKTKYSLISPGTETAFLYGLPNTPRKYPQYPGYSAVGEVIEVGKGVASVGVGDLVCVRGRHSNLLLVPEEEAIRVPERISLLDAVFFELAAISLQGVRKARIELGEEVLIIGAGVIGQLAAQFSKLAGGIPVVIADFIEFRLEKALESGVDLRMNLSEVSVEEGFRRFVGAPSAPVVIEATGNPEAIITALRAARRLGRVVLLGSTRGETTINFYSLVHRKGVSIIGAHISTLPQADSYPGFWTHQKEWDTFFKLLQYDRVRVRHLVTDVIDPKDAPRAYEWLLKEKDRHLAVAIRWD